VWLWHTAAPWSSAIAGHLAALPQRVVLSLVATCCAVSQCFELRCRDHVAALLNVVDIYGFELFDVRSTCNMQHATCVNIM
jgi:hypothetical protein